MSHIEAFDTTACDTTYLGDDLPANEAQCSVSRGYEHILDCHAATYINHCLLCDMVDSPNQDREQRQGQNEGTMIQRDVMCQAPQKAAASVLEKP